MQAKTYLLPPRVDQLLGTLSQLYAREGARELQELIVNARVSVEEETSADGWNGGVVGHTVTLTIPTSMFLNFARKRSEVEKKITDDLNELHHFEHEFIDRAAIVDGGGVGDWRQQSGLLMFGTRDVPPDAEARIWLPDTYRVFLSHKTEVKRETAQLKEDLALFGISAFVAHQDIHPTREWQDEIENALATCDAFVALLSDRFHDSNWTDQEVGYAVARGVPLIAVRLGRDPYGFIGKFQALATDWARAPLEIAKLLAVQDRMVAAYISAVARSRSFNESNVLAEILPTIQRLSLEQADQLVQAYNDNSEVRGGFGFNGSRPRLYGEGLAHHLGRLTGATYEQDFQTIVRLPS